MSDVAIAVEGLGKRYRIGHRREPYGRLTESLAAAVRAPWDRLRGRSGTVTEWFWALRDVSFEVKAGDIVGVIGRNGAGKTTLLKILSRITEPTTGVARLQGRVGSLLEVGTGFHPELTGRENVFMSGAVLGMRRAEIIRKFDEIVEFAGVEQFLDTPVKRYSSGMQVRLGFAVAAHLEPEILVVDEVLAVGDAEFQRKCLGKIEDSAHAGRTVLFVSHNMPAVEHLCSTGVLLDQGRIQFLGTARDAVSQYLATASAIAESTGLAERTDRQGDGSLRFVGLTTDIRTGAPSTIRLEYVGQARLRDVKVLLGIYTPQGDSVAWLSNEMAGQDLKDLPARGALICSLERAPLMPGRYAINIHASAGGTTADYVAEAAFFTVGEGEFFGTGRLPPEGHGHVLVPQTWRAEE
jgi:lipopolysaccharide transport system ATP-binding protein